MAKSSSKGKSGGRTLIGPQTNGKISAPSPSNKGRDVRGPYPKGHNRNSSSK